MRRELLIATLSVSAAMAGIGGSENDAAGLSIGAKAWQEETSLERGDADEMKGDALLWGPTVSLELPERFWLSGTYLQGDMEYDDVDLETDETDTEAVIGRSFDWLDVGAGYRYEEHGLGSMDRVNQLDVEVSGPAVYAELGTSFGDMPLGWYLGGSWMFSDIEDEMENGENFNVEGGLGLLYQRLQGTVGYRYKSFYDFEENLDYQGVTGSLSVRF